MRKVLITPLMLVLIFWAALVRGAYGDAVLGYWTTQDKDAVFEIYRCGVEYCGKIVQMDEPSYPPEDKDLAGLPKMDRKNPDPGLRSRKLLGLTILERFGYDGGNAWSGRVYNPEDGRTYSCKLSIDGGGDRLKVRGYVGLTLLGRTQTWTRQTSPTCLTSLSEGMGRISPACQ
jgi:uncharacterized protein (DUF2147 family)